LALSGLASPQEQGSYSAQGSNAVLEHCGTGVKHGIRGLPGRVDVSCLWLGASGARELALAANNAVRTWQHAAYTIWWGWTKCWIPCVFVAAFEPASTVPPSYMPDYVLYLSSKLSDDRLRVCTRFVVRNAAVAGLHHRAHCDLGWRCEPSQSRRHHQYLVECGAATLNCQTSIESAFYSDRRVGFDLT
jgi:hypothetical protein